MTCASCVRALTEALSDNEGISDVSVNLLGKSASAVIARAELVDSLVEFVGDAGFECEVISVTPFVPPNFSGPSKTATTISSRVVALEVKEMPDGQCAQDIIVALEKLSPSLKVQQAVLKTPNDIIRLTYTPSPPNFTIRTILSAITAAASPVVKVAISHPPSFEDAARRMHKKEQRGLLLRLIVAFLSAIPTLIIGVVYMSLVSKADPVRQYFDESIWAGGVSRGEWALLLLSTPVMFYSASVR